MAMGTVQRGQPSGNSQFLIGLVLGLALMLLTALGTMYALGYLSGQDGAAESAPSVQDAPEPKPTAAWRFRSEWLTPQPK